MFLVLPWTSYCIMYGLSLLSHGVFFFLIGKKNFIKKSQCVHKICTKRPNSYKIEGEAKTEFKETIKSAT